MKEFALIGRSEAQKWKLKVNSMHFRPCGSENDNFEETVKGEGKLDRSQ